jgi:hypothetical protein
MLDLTAMRSAASLTPAVGSLKPDHRRKLRPVDGIKPFVLGADRHRAFLILRELTRGKSLDYTVRDIEHASDVPARPYRGSVSLRASRLCCIGLRDAQLRSSAILASLICDA